MTASPEKTDWITEPIRIPRDWQAAAERLARATYTSRANLLRRALRAGLFVVAHQEDMSEKCLCDLLALPALAPALGRPKLPVHEQSPVRSPADRSPRSRESGRGQKNPGDRRPPTRAGPPPRPAAGKRADR